MCDRARFSRRAVAIDRAFAGRVESLPGDAGGIVDPRLLRFGVATCGLALLDDVAAGLAQARIDLVQFVSVLDLDSEMVETRLPPARGDREIDAGILKHPFRIVGLDHGWLRCEQRGVEADGMGNILDGDVNMQALHGRVLSSRDFGALARRFADSGRRAGHAAAAVFGEKAEQRIHRVELRGVDHRSSFASYGDEAGHPQTIEVEGQSVGREIERLGDRTCRHPLGAGLDQQAENVEAIILASAARAVTAFVFSIFQRI